MPFNFYETKTYKEIAEQQERSIKAKTVDLIKEYSFEEIWHDVIESKDWKEGDVVGIFDGDYIAYTLSAVSDTRSVVVNIDGKDKEFSTRTEFKAYCNEWGLNSDDYGVSDKLTPEDISYCLGTLKRFMKNIKEQLGLTHIIILLGGSYNQRCDILLEKRYKDNRKGMVKPTHLNAVREYLIKYFDTYVITTHEADDAVVAITCEILNNTSARAIAISVDKDSRQALTPFTYYNPQKDELHVLKGGLGDLHCSKKLSGSGLKWLIAQVFLFDRSDNYCMNSYYNKKFGEKSFYDTFKDFDNEHDFLQAVVDKWKELLPENIEYVAWNGENQVDSWLSLAEKHFKLAYMKTSPTDITTLESLLKQHGVDYE